MSVAEQEKRATIVELKGKYDANNSKLKEVSLDTLPDTQLSRSTGSLFAELLFTPNFHCDAVGISTSPC
jgi:hypothetical protein